MEAGGDERVAGEIVRYLAEHPHAMDSLTGIAEWWLMRQRVRDEVQTLERVLQRLVDRGVLEALVTRDDVCYRLTRRGLAPS
jgi:DNA-binding PadR family transcriptional regulator